MALNIFIAIIILLILLMIFVWYMSNKNEKNLIEIQERLDLLKINNTKKLIDDLQDVQLTGASLKSYDEQKQTYNEVVNTAVPDIHEKIEEIRNDNSRFRIFTSHGRIKNQFTQVESVKEQLNEANINLARLSESTRINASQSDNLQTQYHKIRKQILTKSFVYGPAASSLKAELVEIEDLFEKENELTEKGDHLEAKTLLEDIKTKTNIIDDQMKQTEPLYQELIEVFPGQIEEIENVHAQMMAQKFAFIEPGIEEGVMHVTNEIASAKEKLGVFDFESVTIDNQAIAVEIDQLYDILEKEANAKVEATNDANTVFEFLQHAQRQNDALITNLEEVDRHFVLLNNELDTAYEYKKQIFNLSEKYEDTAERVAKSSVIYSQIVTEYNQTKAELTEIETKQREIHSNIQAMYDGERVARVSVNNFKLDMKRQKNVVDQMRLRGLPNEYLDYFRMVGTEINRLQDQLNERHVNVDDISKQLIIVQEDLNNLNQKTKDLIYDVRIAERAIQYANRYINTDQNVNEASNQARRFYDQDFNYHEAFVTIAEALEAVEVGSVDRLKASMDA